MIYEAPGDSVDNVPTAVRGRPHHRLNLEWLEMNEDWEPTIAGPRETEPGRHQLYSVEIAQQPPFSAGWL